MFEGIKYSFKARVWVYRSAGGWHFVSMPQDLSKEIRQNLQWQEEGWGRMNVTAQIGNYSWKTSIWFDTKTDAYILPLKAEVRNKQNIKVDDLIEVAVCI